jgi:ubiquinone/menaquinone biosynthesis C-methylase UbiE
VVDRRRLSKSQPLTTAPSQRERGKKKSYRAIAEYYDAEHERTKMLRRDVPFFLRHLPKRRQSVLELATGTGRAAIPIAQAGHEVVGVDYAADMLDIARRKRDAVGVSDRSLKLIEADILTLNLRRRFDWVCIFFNTLLGFTTLTEQDRLLQVVRRHLKPTGRFWIDIFQPSHEMLAERESIGIDAHAFYVPRFDRTVFMNADVRRDMSRQWMEVTFNYRWFDPRGREHKQRVRFDMTAIFPRELRLLLERNGFVIQRLWGDYDGSILSAKSPRMIACCRRA